MYTLKRLCPIFISLAVLLAACTSPVKTTTLPSTDQAAYTAAAETISAQLTEITNPTLTQPVTNGTQPAAGVQPTETLPERLPDTSTPLPTRTPLPSDTPTVTPTPLPTDTPTPTTIPTKGPDDPKARLGEPTWQDTFQDGNGWFLFSDGHVEMKVSDGKLWMTAFNADRYDGWMLHQPILDVANFFLEVTATTSDCSGLDRYGLLARSTADARKTYLFGISCDGHYSLRYWDGSSSTMIVVWTASEAILKGADQTNRMGFLAEGSKLSLYANGTLLTSIEDETLASGDFGLFVGSYETPSFTVQVSKVLYWELPLE